MNDYQPVDFTCRACGAQRLNVTRVWRILAGPVSESWQEWGPLEPNHLWHFEFKEKIEKNKDNKVERGESGDLAEDDSDSEPGDYETFEPDGDPEGDEFYVNCAGCDREIEFGWAKPDRGGGIFPVAGSDFIPGDIWPEPRYLEFWQRKGWLKKGAKQA